MDNFYFRNKIIVLNIILTFMIVLLHAKSPERFGMEIEDYPIIYAISMLCRMATPLFFFVSALLFLKGCTFNDLERKYTSRIHSLLIPYILWNIIFVAIFWFLVHIPALSSKMHIGSILNTPKEIIIAIFNSSHTDLWFIKNLMFYTLMAPVFLCIFKNKQVSFLIEVLLLCVAIYIEPEYKSLLRWLPIYYMGAMCGYYWENQDFGRFICSRHSPIFTFSLVFILASLYILSLWKNNDLYIIYSSPLLIWFIVDGLLYKTIQNLKIKKWMSYMFFIFCTHHFVLNVLQKIVVLCCEPNNVVIFLTYIISSIVCVLILIKVADLISHHKFYKVLTGGR